MRLAHSTSNSMGSIKSAFLSSGDERSVGTHLREPARPEDARCLALLDDRWPGDHGASSEIGTDKDRRIDGRIAASKDDRSTAADRRLSTLGLESTDQDLRLRRMLRLATSRPRLGYRRSSSRTPSRTLA